MSSFILQSEFSKVSNIQDFAKQINQFVCNLKTKGPEVKEAEAIEVIIPHLTPTPTLPNPNDLGKLFSSICQPTSGGPNGFGNVLQSLMGNQEIMSLASDLSRDIQSQNLDPMALLSSMMSGKPNGAIEDLVNNITGKIEEKINNGDIDKNLLESQAQSILNNINGSV